MKTLILIILKIGETALFIIALILVFLVLILLIEYVIPEHINDWMRQFVHSGIGKIIMIAIQLFALVYWTIYFIRNFKKWITQNKEWSNNIYNKLT